MPVSGSSCVVPDNGNRGELGRVVLSAESRGAQKQPEDLWIGGRRPARHAVEKQEDQNAAREAVQEIEGRRTKAHGEEKQFALRAENGQRARKRAVYRIDSLLHHRRNS